MHQVRQQQLRDVHQHQAHEDLAGMKARAQECRYRGPGHAAEHPGYQLSRLRPMAERSAVEQTHTPAGNRPERELSFGADIPDVGAVT